MKVLRPAVTCVLTSHMKPAYLGDALQSLVDQTRRDFEVIVADSGQWIGVDDAGSQAMLGHYEKWSRLPLVTWVTTGEPPDLRFKRCPVAWVTNEVIRAGLVRGRYMCTFYDDDRYLPRFMEVMAGYLDTHPAGAVMCSQTWWRSNPNCDNGFELFAGITADQPRGPGEFDCMVDGGQVMWRTELLDKIGDPWLPESPDSCHHSDGLFLERLARATGTVDAVLEVLCENRKTPVSAYAPHHP